MNKLLVLGLTLFSITLLTIVLQSCASTAHINGSYTNVFAGMMGEELRFNEPLQTFQYYRRTEGAITGYSAGTWKRDKKELLINGFADVKINVLNVESKIEILHDANRDKLVINYNRDPLDTVVKVDVIINGNVIVPVSKDTMLFSGAIRTLQVKSYINHEGFISTAPQTIDALNSSIITVSTDNHKAISLNFGVDRKDFYRVKLTDTLVIKNSRILQWGNKKFKKIGEDEAD